MRRVLAAMLLLLALLAPPASGQHEHEHEHEQETTRAPGDLEHEGHLPIQVYYHRSFFEAPWRTAGTDREVAARALWLLAADGLLLAFLWRFRWRR